MDRRHHDFIYTECLQLWGVKGGGGGGGGRTSLTFISFVESEVIAKSKKSYTKRDEHHQFRVSCGPRNARIQFRMKGNKYSPSSHKDHKSPIGMLLS